MNLSKNDKKWISAIRGVCNKDTVMFREEGLFDSVYHTLKYGKTVASRTTQQKELESIINNFRERGIIRYDNDGRYQLLENNIPKPIMNNNRWIAVLAALLGAAISIIMYVLGNP